MCDFDKKAGTLFFAVARSLPNHTVSMYVYVGLCTCIHAIHWRSHGVMKNPHKILVGKGKLHNIQVENLDVVGATLILILNNQVVYLIN